MCYKRPYLWPDAAVSIKYIDTHNKRKLSERGEGQSQLALGPGGISAAVLKVVMRQPFSLLTFTPPQLCN